MKLTVNLDVSSGYNKQILYQSVIALGDCLLDLTTDKHWIYSEDEKMAGTARGLASCEVLSRLDVEPSLLTSRLVYMRGLIYNKL